MDIRDWFFQFRLSDTSKMQQIYPFPGQNQDLFATICDIGYFSHPIKDKIRLYYNQLFTLMPVQIMREIYGTFLSHVNLTFCKPSMEPAAVLCYKNEISGFLIHPACLEPKERGNG